MIPDKREEYSSSTLIIVATLNEESGIGPTLSELNGVLDKPICLVADGRSIDGTAKIAESMGAQVVLQKGLGKGDAIAIAIEHSRSLNVKYVVFTDADFTYPAEYLPRMIKILEENPHLGMVCGDRFADNVSFKAIPEMFYAGNRFLAFAHNLLNGVNLNDPLTGLRVVRWEILKDWKPKSKGFDVEVELNHLVENKGFGIMEIPIQYRPRLGEKKLKIRHGFTIFRRILIESM
jgi:dolichol-phosphate mannosyltransferase